MSELVEFKSSLIHGLGGFAKCDIQAGTKIIEYVGQKIDKTESARRCEANNEYIFYLDEDYDLDGDVGWNPAKFINHGCSPNCEAEMIGQHIWIVAKRDISAGEELTFNYGYDDEDYQDHPCRCGSPDCLGYIVAEEFHERVRSEKQVQQERNDSNSDHP